MAARIANYGDLQISGRPIFGQLSRDEGGAIYNMDALIINASVL